MGPKMLEMAGRHADGVLPLLYPPERYATVRPLVMAGAGRPLVMAGAGLRPQDFAPAAELAQRGPGNRQSAAALVDDRMLSLGVAGGVADVLARCRALVRLGASHLSFGPPLGPDPVTAVRLLGEQVLPLLRR
jgi:5,10-methylenetetrahydromethanopterin reductase